MISKCICGQIFKEKPGSLGNHIYYKISQYWGQWYFWSENKTPLLYKETHAAYILCKFIQILTCLVSIFLQTIQQFAGAADILVQVVDLLSMVKEQDVFLFITLMMKHCDKPFFCRQMNINV